MSEPVPDPAATGAILAELRRHPRSAGWSAATLERLAAASVVESYRAGETIMRQGEPSDWALWVLEGECDVLYETSQRPIRLVRRPDSSLVGEIGIFTDLPRTATVQALGAVRGLRVQRATVLALGRENPDFLLAVLNQLGRYFAAVNHAVAVYVHALAALERREHDPNLLALHEPLPELADFHETLARLAAQIARREAEHVELDMAAAIQRSMLPAPLAPDAFAGRVDVAARMRPAREVGGDLYDFFALDQRRLTLAIGDVSGKGVPASLFMGEVRTALRVVARSSPDLASALQQANALIAADNQESMFATLFCAVLDAETGRLAYCNCGHNPAWLIRAGGGSERLRHTGVPLAAAAEARWRVEYRALAPGDRLFLYTDGVTEAENPQGAQFGEERLGDALAALREGSAEAMVAGVVERIDAFAAGAAQTDDIACLALVWRG